MKKETLGTLLALATAVFSGVAIPANKVFIVDVDPAVFTAVRSVVIGVIFFLLIQFSSGKASGKPNGGTRKGFAVSWKYLASIAVIGGAFAFLLFFSGLKLTTAGRAAFLHKTLPLYVALLAFVFLRERITRKYLIAIMLMFIGTIGIYSASINPAELWSNPQLGDLLVISAAFLWGVENVIAKRAMARGEASFVVSFARMFFGGLILMGVVVLTGRTGALLSLTAQNMVSIGVSTALLFAYVFAYYWSLKLINVSKAAVLLLLAPVVSLVLGTAFLGEPAPLQQLAGSAVILVGACLVAGIRSEEREI